MRLSLINESTNQELYKGLSQWSGLDHWLENQNGVIVPGFLAPYEIARVYSEPELTGTNDQKTAIMSVAVGKNEIEDLTVEFRKWHDTNYPKKFGSVAGDYDVSLGFPTEWRNRIWTVLDGGSAHRTGLSCFGFCEFVYCGKPKPFKIIKSYNNQDEWAKDKHMGW